ncbi:hypothetical protein C2G38_2068551 [Gigaspora rosea]|uniref:TLDc domain-containing protein n=1 Tax=Gigaspora rosea TaxID=44941 RepID=A0A397VYB4_9GLOM|nr:hypothetical protein C2G38_2068551 [Gigaspora rosea]
MQYRFKDIPFEFKLIYQASRENFSVNKFHMNCDFKGPTIVTIKIRNSNEIIGGYNPLDWGENNENNDYDFKKSSKSFIFSLFSLNNGAIPRLSSISYQKEAIVWSSARGPCFGFKDLWIENNSSQRSALGISEQLSYETGIINKHVFEIEEYEVFQVIHKESSFKVNFNRTVDFIERFKMRTVAFIVKTSKRIFRFIVGTFKLIKNIFITLFKLIINIFIVIIIVIMFMFMRIFEFIVYYLKLFGQRLRDCIYTIKFENPYREI